MAAPTTTIETMRRSTRIRAQIPVRVRSLDTSVPFDLLTTTIIVNAQGCGVQSDTELPLDLPVELSMEGRTITGRTLNSAVIDASRSIYITGIALDRPGNFWGLASPPVDWAQFAPEPTAKKVHPFAKRRAGAEPNGNPSNSASAATGSDSSDDLRERLDAALAEYTARARAESAAQWQKWKEDAIEALNEIRHNLGAELSVDAEAWKRDTQRAEESLKAMLKAGEERARNVEEQATKALSDLRKLTESAPKVFADRAVEAVEAITVETKRTIAAAVAAEMESLGSRIREMSTVTGEPARAGLLADLEARQQDFTREITARIAELEAKGSNVQTSADEISARISRQTEEAMAALRHQVEEALAKHEAEIAARVSGRNQEITKHGEAESAARMQALQQAAEKALQEIDVRGQVLANSREQLERAAEAAMEKIDASRQEAQKAAEVARDSIAARQSEVQASIDQAASTALNKLEEALQAGQGEIDKRIQEQSWDFEAQSEAAHARLQEKLTSALQRIDSDIEQKRAAISSEHSGSIASELAKAADGAKTSIAEEQARQLQSFRAQIDTDLRQRKSELQAAHKEAAAGLEALTARQKKMGEDLAELEKTRSYLESLMTSLPETVRAQAEQQASKVWSVVRERSEKQIADALALERDRAAASLREEIATSAKRMREELAAHAQHTATELQAKLAEEITRRRGQIIAELQANATQITQSAAAAFTSEAKQDSERRAAESEAVHRKALQRLEDVAQKSDRLLGETEAALYKSAGEVVGGELQRAHSELQERAAKQSEEVLAKLREQSDAVVADKVSSFGALTSQASELVSQLAESAARADAKTEALEKQLEDAQKWLAAHTAEFEKTVHDAFLTARGEIKGRVASAADTAEELIRQKSREAVAGVEATAMGHAAVVAQQTEEAEARIRAMQASASESAENLLKERLAETLEVFRADAARLAESTIQRWQSAMEDTLRSVPEMMKIKMSGAGSNPAD